jgi:TPR repeat protein
MFVGDAYLWGLGVAPDEVASAAYYHRACSLGMLEACVSAGLADVEHQKRNVVDVLADVWGPACEKGSYNACFLAGFVLARDNEKTAIRDVPRGRAYLEKACAARYLRACYDIAVLVIESRDTSGYAAAHQQLIEGCRLREEESCHYLGLMEMEGTFGERNERQAAEHFWRACYDGSGESCLAVAYLAAKGVVNRDQDFRKNLVDQGCRFGYQVACEALEHPERELPPPARR